MNVFRLTPDYAGLTVSVDIWDVGDIASSNGFVRINVNDLVRCTCCPKPPAILSAWSSASVS